MQPVHCCMSARVASSMSGSAITSDTAKRPPGRSTRAASRSTAALSAARLITQFEMTTSTLASGSGSPRAPRAGTRRCPHLPRPRSGARGRAPGGHVQPEHPSTACDPARGDQHIGTGPGSKVQHGLTGAQLGHRGRYAAAQGRRQRLRRRPGGLGGVVELVGRIQGLAWPEDPPVEPRSGPRIRSRPRPPGRVRGPPQRSGPRQWRTGRAPHRGSNPSGSGRAARGVSHDAPFNRLDRCRT